MGFIYAAVVQEIYVFPTAAQITRLDFIFLLNLYGNLPLLTCLLMYAIESGFSKKLLVTVKQIIL